MKLSQTVTEFYYTNYAYYQYCKHKNEYLTDTSYILAICILVSFGSICMFINDNFELSRLINKLISYKLKVPTCLIIVLFIVILLAKYTKIIFKFV